MNWLGWSMLGSVLCTGFRYNNAAACILMLELFTSLYGHVSCQDTPKQDSAVLTRRTVVAKWMITLLRT